jgi:hypothetical protein
MRDKVEWKECNEYVLERLVRNSSLVNLNKIRDCTMCMPSKSQLRQREARGQLS